MIHNIKNWIYRARVLFKRNALEYIVFFSCSCAAIIDAYNFPARKAFTYLNVVLTGAAVAISLREKMNLSKLFNYLLFRNYRQNHLFFSICL